MEKINWPETGKYIVAVSGGVDSMSLLQLLAEKKDMYELIVAHCNHGIRPDADKDEELVERKAGTYGLEFVSVRLELGRDVGEAEARARRYEFLHEQRVGRGADAVITAHHLDDRIETMLLNKQRGAGWYGLSPLHETETVKRPLLEVSKAEIVAYAESNGVEWREDTTNFDPEYTPRNYLRGAVDRKAALEDLRTYDERRDRRLAEIAPALKGTVSGEGVKTFIYRAGLLKLDGSTARDVLYFALRRYSDMLDIDKDAVHRLEHFCKTARPGKRLILSTLITVIARSNGVEITATHTDTR